MRCAAPVMLPPSRATQVSGMSARARPVLSVRRRPISLPNGVPAVAAGTSPICAERVFAATGSASATTTSALSMWSTET